MAERFRYVHLGVAAGLIAAALTSVSVLRSGAAGSDASSFVPITPCRLMDTRPAPDNIGARTTPIGPDGTYDALVWGTNGNCTIPTTATAVSLNVTAIGPTANSFLTVYPSDATRPLAASLNWITNQPPTPNAVTTTLSTNGRVSFYNLAGNVDLTADIVGYYEPSTAGPAGPTGPAGQTGATGATGATGRQGLPGNRTNRLTRDQIATLQWWLDPGRPAVIGVGDAPSVVASDGRYVWVANASSNSVSKIDPTTNEVIAAVGVGTTPGGIEFDGTHLWVSNFNSGTVTKIDPVTDQVLNPAIAVGANPLDLVYDGTAIWVSNLGGDSLSRISLGTGNAVDTVNGFDNPYGITFDGTRVWVVNQSTTGNTTLVPVTTSLPYTLGTPVVLGAANSDPQYAVYDGTRIWVTMRFDDRLSRVSLGSNPAATEFDISAQTVNPVGITYDGTHLWITSNGDDRVLQIDPDAPGTVIASFPVGGGPRGITYDGTNLWVVATDDDQVHKVVPF